MSKSTSYALHAVMELARAGAKSPVTVTQVAERHGIPATVLAKVFQRLVHAGLAVSMRGTRGGYALARPPSRVSVLELIDAFESPRAPGQCLLRQEEGAACPAPGDCRLRRLFDEVEGATRSKFAAVSLETLVGELLEHR